MANITAWVVVIVIQALWLLMCLVLALGVGLLWIIRKIARLVRFNRD